MDSEKYEKLVGLATELVEQVRAEALVSLRFLDVALYKLKFRFDVNTSLYTDGEFLYMNPYYIFSLYKSEDNMLLRSYLHVILHCIFFHLFIDKNVDKDRWDLACDICVENIINELNLPTLLEDNKNPQIGELNILKVKVTELTAEKLYNYFMVYGITDDELKRLQVLFKRDEHDFWYLDTGNIGSKEGKKKKDDNYKEQNKNETNDEKVEENEHDKTNKEEQDVNNNENYDNIPSDPDKLDDEEDNEHEDMGANVDGDKNEADTGEEENPDADSTNKSDINDNKNEEEREGGENVDRPVKTKNKDRNVDSDEMGSIQDEINKRLGRDKNERLEDNTENRANVKPDDEFKSKHKNNFDIENATYNEWKNISERTKEDLLMFASDYGERTNTLKQYIKDVNREKYSYEKFLQKFAIIGENVELNDEEFDNIYYTYGLNLYKNVPLVEPLEYKEVKKIKEFVIAIDVSGSVKGDLVQKFIEKTYNVLSQRENYFTKVNIHVLLCDTEIKEDIKIENFSDLKRKIESIVLKGFGGTDFRPVFKYINELKDKGEYKNLKGLIYFTDGLGEFPKEPPDYDTSFVFLREDYDKNEKNLNIPPWCIKIILDDI